jgi:hypothetical protein
MATTPLKKVATCNSMNDKIISPLEGVTTIDHNFGAM